jgi:diguanylate cyclase (GGDEF)-like protein
MLERIRSADNLPSLPTVAIKVLELSRREDASVDELAVAIQQDPALTAKVLRMVNSSLYGLSREIGSINQAVGLLGLRSVKVMALSFSLVESVAGDDSDGFDYAAYWRRALTTAVAARLFGKAVAPRVADEAFVSGLLADLGTVAAWRCAPEAYRPMHQEWRSSKDSLPKVELRHFGFTHAKMSAALLERWGLPEAICQTVGAHHGEGLSEVTVGAELARVVHAAAIVSDLFCQEIASTQLDSVKQLCIDAIGIEPAALEEVLHAIDEHVTTTASMLSVKVGDTVNYAQLQGEAAMQLAQLSMQAEAERRMSEKREQAAIAESTRLHEEKKQILEVASTDGLTKIANRAAFDKRLEEAQAQARSQARPIGLIILDVDHFKSFNDTYGHQAGDEVLRRVAECLRDVAGKTAFVARYGGEEFVAIASNQTITQVRDLAEAIRSGIERMKTEWQGTELRVTASLGAVVIEPAKTPISCAKLIERADKLLYQAKHNGRNRVQAANLVPVKPAIATAT